MGDDSEVDRINQTIAALEGQRAALGDAVVDTAVAPLRARLAALQAGAHHERRKLVTIVFADVVGSTELSAQLDPEDMRELLNAFFSQARSSIERHGGVVEKFIGDAVMAVFGLAVAKEDDPERAVRAAMEIAAIPRDLVVELGWPQPFSTRVGVNTGEVVVGALGERLEDEFVVVGEPVNVASRVQNAASPDGVLITHDTFRHVQEVFDVDAVEPLRLKGIAHPVQAYRVVAAKRRPFVGGRGVEGVVTRVVGRSAELQRLQDAFVRTVHERQVRAVTIVGDAGIGKSRVLAEFDAWLARQPDPPLRSRARASPATQSAPYSLVRDLLSAHLGIDDSEPIQSVRQKLERGYVEAVPDNGENAGAREAHVLGVLLGFELAVTGAAPVERDARALHDEALAHLRAFVIGLARQRPVVLLLDDLHWADATSLDVVEYLLDAITDLPLLVVGAARPALHERRPGWGERHERLDLGALSHDDSVGLMEQILAKVEHLPPMLTNLVVDTAEGNPFFLEELLKMLIEDGVIRISDERWHVDGGRLMQIHVPPSLTGVLQARLDGLGVDERAYLQRGAVVGRVFWDSAVDFLGGQAAPEAIPAQLRMREMILERGHSTFEDSREYSFKHALLRDVTYESILKRQRRRLHGLVARWLQEVAERNGRADQFAILIAGHHADAGEDALAAEWYVRAGIAAASRYANAEAVHALTRALELTAADDAEHQFEVRLRREKVYELQGAQEARALELGELQSIADRIDDAAAHATVAFRHAAFALSVSDFPLVLSEAARAIELAERAGEMTIAADSELLRAQALLRQGELVEARRSAERSLATARRSGQAQTEASSRRHLGLIAYYSGAQREALDHFSAALDLCVACGDTQGEVAAVNNLGGATFELGDHGAAGDYYARSLALARAIGDRFGEGRGLNNLGLVAVVGGDYARAEENYLGALEISRQLRNRSMELSALDNLGNVALYRYQFTRAREYHAAALDGARQLGDRVSETFLLVNLARGCLSAGDLDGARECVDTGLAIAAEVGDVQSECELLLCLARWEATTDDWPGAHAHGERAMSLARQHDLQAEEASARFVLGDAALASGNAREAFDHHAAALAIRQNLNEPGELCDSHAGVARALLALGHVGEAMVHVEEILDGWNGRGLLGLGHPVVDIVSCYRTLAAANDERSFGVLERGYRLLRDMAAGLDDDDQRRAFLEDLPPHRELVAIWETARPKRLED